MKGKNWQSVDRKRQNGFSMIGLIVVLCIAMFFALFAFKVGPSYFEYMTVKSIADTIADDTELMKKPKSKVMDALAQSFRANSLWELKPEDSFTLQKDGAKGYLVTIDYEKRATLFSNIDVVTTFNKVAGSD